MTDPRSAIPSIDSLIGSEAFASLRERYPRARIVQAARQAVTDVRAALERGNGDDDVSHASLYALRAAEHLRAGDVPSLRPVINASGVVLHTNLGRAPLASAAVEAMLEAARAYSNLEYDLGAGERGSRYVHCAALLTELTGAEDALVVNNAAAALLLALNTLAGGAGVAVSRGELLEIGGGFRIPEILERSAARLVEVGSTNRTRLRDYEEALADDSVRLLLKVHRSNFRITGFTEEAALPDLAGLASARGLPLVHDLGSGLLVDAGLLGLPPEPTPPESLAAGSDLVTFSGDKLLGGPQAGVVLGRRDLVERLRRNPMCRALRVDKVTLAGLEATLRLYRDPAAALREIPTLRMLSEDPASLRERVGRLVAELSSAGVDCHAVETSGAVGGGTCPGVELASWAVALEAEHVSDTATALRHGDPPVVGRIVEGRLLFDVRTVLPGQEPDLVRRIGEALGPAARR